MNNLLLTIGIAIILVAAAAIAAPFVVDWSSQRTFFEAQASRILGQPVTIEGPIDARLLPEPSFRFVDMTIGTPDADGDGSIAIEGLNVSLSPGSLLKGQIEITAAEIEAPAFSLAIDEAGALRVPTVFTEQVFDPARVSADTIQIRDGQVEVVDAAKGTSWTLAEISGDAAVRALDGPYRFDGGFILRGERYGARFATGKADGQAIPVSLVLESSGRPLVVEIDGNAAFDGDRPTLEAALNISHGLVTSDGTEIGPIWRVEGPLKLDPDQLDVTAGTLVFGAADREIKLTGKGTLPLRADGDAVIRLDGRQIDFDRFLGNGPENPSEVSQTIALLTEFGSELSGAGYTRRGTDLELALTTAIISGDIVQDIRLAGRAIDDQFEIASFAAKLPGGADLRFAGTASGFGGDVAMDGDVQLSALNIIPAIRWAATDEIAGLRDAESVVTGLSVASEIRVGQGRLELPAFEGRLREAPFSGRVDYTAATSETPAEIKLGLEANVLDLPAIDLFGLVPPENPDERAEPAPARGWAWLDNAIIDLDIGVQTLFVGDAGIAGVVADMTVSDGAFDIRTLKIDDVRGTSLDASGTISGWPAQPDGTITFDAAAASLDDITPLLSEFGIALPALAQAGGPGAGLYEPARLDGELSAGLTDDGARLRISARGQFGDTDITVEGDYESTSEDDDNRFVTVDLGFQNPSSRALLAQLGVAALDDDLLQPDDPPGNIALLMRGVPSDALETLGDARLLNTDIELNGTSRIDAEGEAEVDLDFEVTFEDPSSVLAFVGLPGGGDTGSGRLAGRLQGHPHAPELKDLKGAIGSVGVSGDLRLRDTGPRMQIAGDLLVEDADLRWLLGTAFVEGVGLDDLTDATGADADQAWSTVPIVPSSFAGLDLDLSMRSGRLTLTDTMTLADARYRLRTTDGALSIDPITGLLFANPVSAALDLRPSISGVSFSARAQIEDADLEALSGLLLDEPPASGRIDLNVQVEGQGRSMKALVASLGGEGRYTIKAASVRKLSPNAFPLIARAADADLALEDGEVARVFASHLDGGPLSVNNAVGVFSLAGGVARLSNTILDSERAQVRVSGALDFANMDVDATLSLTPEGSAALVAAQTEVLVNLEGPVSAPFRSIDVSALTGYLSVRKFEREVERIETLQADILERQRLARELVLNRQQLASFAAEAEARPQEETTVEQPADGAVVPQPAPRPGQRAGSSGAGDSFGNQIRSALTGGDAASALGGDALEPLPAPIEIRPLTIREQ